MELLLCDGAPVKSEARPNHRRVITEARHVDADDRYRLRIVDDAHRSLHGGLDDVTRNELHRGCRWENAANADLEEVRVLAIVLFPLLEQCLVRDADGT